MGRFIRLEGFTVMSQVSKKRKKRIKIGPRGCLQAPTRLYQSWSFWIILVAYLIFGTGYLCFSAWSKGSLNPINRSPVRWGCLTVTSVRQRILSTLSASTIKYLYYVCSFMWWSIFERLLSSFAIQQLSQTLFSACRWSVQISKKFCWGTTSTSGRCGITSALSKTRCCIDPGTQNISEIQVWDKYDIIYYRHDRCDKHEIW